MANPPATWLNNHLRLNQPVLPGGDLLALDIFEHNPTQLQHLHPSLCFITPVHGKKRQALQGQWKRRSGERSVNNNHGIKIGIRRTYDWKWSRTVQPRPGFVMTEYMRSAHCHRAVCVLRRVQAEPQVQELQGAQVHGVQAEPQMQGAQVQGVQAEPVQDVDEVQAQVQGVQAEPQVQGAQVQGVQAEPVQDVDEVQAQVQGVQAEPQVQGAQVQGVQAEPVQDVDEVQAQVQGVQSEPQVQGAQVEGAQVQGAE